MPRVDRPDFRLGEPGRLAPCFLRRPTRPTPTRRRGRERPSSPQGECRDLRMSTLRASGSPCGHLGRRQVEKAGCRQFGCHWGLVQQCFRSGLSTKAVAQASRLCLEKTGRMPVLPGADRNWIDQQSRQIECPWSNVAMHPSGEGGDLGRRAPLCLTAGPLKINGLQSVVWH